MKSLFLALTLLSATLLSSTAYSQKRSCDIANESFCKVDTSLTSIQADLHGSGHMHCGLKILTNQNFPTYLLEDLVANLEVNIRGHLGLIKMVNHSIEITDVNGSLPSSFILSLNITTKLGESIQEIIDRQFAQTNGLLKAPIELIVLPIRCNQ